MSGEVVISPEVISPVEISPDVISPVVNTEVVISPLVICPDAQNFLESFLPVVINPVV